VIVSRLLTIVVGEDQALVREGVVRMLERAGLTIAGAADATDLLRLTRTHRPDVVITDIRMPPRLADDGLRAAIEIRATEPGIGVIAWPSVFGERGAGTSVGRPHPGRRHPTSRAPYGAGTSSIRRKSEHSRSIADSRFSTVATTAVCVQTQRVVPRVSSRR
jgi:CheY-like chemotaxis protein